MISREPGRMIRVALLTRPGCHLCDEMKGVLARATQALPVVVRKIDISGSPALEERHGLDIPVLFIDGQKAFEHRVTEGELRQRLEAVRRG